MSTVTTSLATWDEFLRLPDDENGSHLELQDGEVITVRPARPIHIFVQALLNEWLSDAARGFGKSMPEFPYRPASNLQFWRADIAYIPDQDLRLMQGDDYPIYAPPLIIEVLSPSNKPEKLHRQRIAAFSAGTEEFWVVDISAQTIEVSLLGHASRVYGIDDTVPVSVLSGAAFPVRTLFPR